MPIDMATGRQGRLMSNLLDRGETTVAHPRPLDRARAISGLISEEALAAERLGRLTDNVSTAMLDANLFSILLPAADGGLGGTSVELFGAVEEIARADGSAGWCTAISNAISSFVHKGGYRVSGNFAWGSSSSLSRWVMVPARLEDRDGQQWFRAHVLPKDDAEIKEAHGT